MADAPHTGTGEVVRAARPRFDPELEAVLATFPPESRGSVRPEDIEQLRQRMRSLRPGAAQLAMGGAVDVEVVTAPGLTGGPEVELLVLRPSARDTARACVYYMHSGGMIAGDKELRADVLAGWVVEAGVVAVSVDYRLAPEHPYPAALDDCYAGLTWVVDHADDLGIDPARVIVCGTSAGGGLAAALCLLARDRGWPYIAQQILQCPMIDDRNRTPSSFELDGEGVWDRTSNTTGWSAWLGDSRGGPDVPPYAAPARATDLHDLPDAYIDVGQADVFRDETIDFAQRLAQQGVLVEFHLWAGAWHGFDYTAPHAAVSQAANATRLAYLRRVAGS